LITIWEWYFISLKKLPSLLTIELIFPLQIQPNAKVIVATKLCCLQLPFGCYPNRNNLPCFSWVIGRDWLLKVVSEYLHSDVFIWLFVFMKETKFSKNKDFLFNKVAIWYKKG
jgi:hypothetical protein